LLPVAGILYRNGDPGLTPKILAPFIRGSGPGFGVSITPDSFEHEIKTAERNVTVIT